MADRNFKPDSGNELVFEDAGSTDRLRITDGGSTILYDEGGTAALTIATDGDIYTIGWTLRDWTGTGWDSLTSNFGAYKCIGNQVYIVGYVWGTSNSTSSTITNLPYPPALGGDNWQGLIIPYTQDGGTPGPNATGYVYGLSSATNIIFFLDNAQSGWTNTGDKRFRFSGWYEAESI